MTKVDFPDYFDTSSEPLSASFLGEKNGVKMVIFRAPFVNFVCGIIQR